MARLQVPDGDKPSVIELTRMSQDQVLKLNGALSAGRASRSETELGMKDWVSNPASALNALISMTAARLAHGISADELHRMLLDSLGSEAGNTRLDILLENANILRFAKRLDLETAFERGLHTFRVITDIRPIFDEDVSSGIGAALVTHTIQLTYIRDNEFQELYVAADLGDLRTIRKQIDRAIQKAEMAEEFVAKTGAAVLTEKEDAQ